MMRSDCTEAMHSVRNGLVRRPSGLLCSTLSRPILLAYAWHSTKPEYHGFDWIPVSVLTYPGCVVIYVCFQRELLPMPFEVLIGLGLNSIAIYLLARFSCYI